MLSRSILGRRATTTSARCSRAMSTRVPIVGGNWKCNAGKGITAADVDTLVGGLNGLPEPSCEVYIAPPAIYLDKVQSAVSPNFQVSAQNVWKETSGAYTGEISAEMLMDMGVGYTLIGHSERRDIFGETDELLGAKIAHAQGVGLKVVACIGEHKEDREAGTTMDVLVPQLQAIVDNTTDFSKLVIAYEPVWAIGTGLTATPQQAQDTHADIRTWLSGAAGADVADAMRIQYGGSANDKNCHDLAAGADVDGFLVGGACLAAESFGVILATFD
jgi:triosephosphate isomerase